MLIFLDDSEDKKEALGAITESVLVALIQKPCILLISRSLLRNIFHHLARSKNKLVQQVMKQFDPKEWLTKIPLKGKLSNEFVLMIPKSYVVESALVRGFKSTVFEDLMQEKDFNIDKLLGLHLSRMGDLISVWRTKIRATEGIISTKKSFAELLSESHAFFVAAHEYKDDKRNALPQWNIYMTGHGSAKHHEIGGISNDTFKKLLNFLNSKIITKMFIYESCEASGVNRVQVYDEISKNFGATYPFPIIAIGISESTVEFKPHMSYKEFTQLAELSDAAVNSTESMTYARPVAYYELLRAVIYGFDAFMKGKMETEKLDAGLFISNFSFIRFPQRSIFLPLMPMCEITQLMADTRDVHKPLDLREFIQKNIDPQLALPASEISKDRAFFTILDAQYVPFNIIVTTQGTEGAKNPFFIISTLTGNTLETSMHIFDQHIYFDGPIWDFGDIFNHLEYAQDKTFYIERLTTKVDDGDDGNDLETSHVIIHIPKGRGKTKIFYTTVKSDQKYSLKIPLVETPQKLTDNYLEDYERAITLLRDKFGKRRKDMSAQEEIIARGFKKTTSETFS